MQVRQLAVHLWTLGSIRLVSADEVGAQTQLGHLPLTVGEWGRKERAGRSPGLGNCFVDSIEMLPALDHEDLLSQQNCMNLVVSFETQ